jgi:plasmid maintenance system antidote protein VapI
MHTDENLIPAPDMIAGLGDILKEEIKARHLKRAAFARTAGLPAKTVAALLANKVRPDQNMAKSISRGLGSPKIDFVQWILLDRNYLWNLLRNAQRDAAKAKKH